MKYKTIGYDFTKHLYCEKNCEYTASDIENIVSHRVLISIWVIVDRKEKGIKKDDAHDEPLEPSIFSLITVQI